MGEAGVVWSSEGGETVHLEGADGVTAARGELLADGVDTIFIYVKMDGEAPPSVQDRCYKTGRQVDSWTGALQAWIMRTTEVSVCI